MSLCVIYYCPSAAGNHLKNLVNLAPEMHDHGAFNTDLYSGTQSQGTAHSRAGRNLYPDDLRRIIQDPDHNWSICAHFGELAPKRDLLMQIPDRRFIIIGIESPTDRWLLETRQQRLGQQCHPYWLHEEQPYLYDRPIVKEYWRTLSCIKIPLEHFWNPDLRHHAIVPDINRFLDINIPEDRASDLHRTWWLANFDREDVRLHYAQHLTNLV